MLFINYLEILFAIFSVPGRSQRIERKCFDNDSPVGIYLGIPYQLIYVTERLSLELECRGCNETFNPVMNVSWSLIELNRTATNPVYHHLKPKSKQFKKHMEILKNGTLGFNKIRMKANGLYTCFNAQLNDIDNSTKSASFSYLVQVNGKKMMSVLPNGTLTDWNKYRDSILGEAAQKLDDESLEDQIVALKIIWSTWTDCLCGTYKFDTRRFRYAYVYVSVNESDQQALIFPTQSHWLQNFYPELAYSVKNISVFHEYERCIGECKPDVLYQDVEYRYEQSVYLSEGLDSTFICPDSENASEVLWITNETTVLQKSLHSLGTTGQANHVSVDMLDELHLVQVRPSEAGIYSCIVNTMPVKKIVVFIIQKSLFLSKDFQDCLLTLAHVLVFCFFVCLLVSCVKICHIYSQYME